MEVGGGKFLIGEGLETAAMEPAWDNTQTIKYLCSRVVELVCQGFV